MFDTLHQRWHQFAAVPPGQRFQAHFARQQQTRPRGLHQKILANLLVCLLVDDMPDQADAAEALLVANTAFISRIVLLESEWVLRSGYRKTREQVSIPRQSRGLYGIAPQRRHKTMCRPRRRGFAGKIMLGNNFLATPNLPHREIHKIR